MVSLLDVPVSSKTSVTSSHAPLSQRSSTQSTQSQRSSTHSLQDKPVVAAPVIRTENPSNKSSPKASPKSTPDSSRNSSRTSPLSARYSQEGNMTPGKFLIFCQAKGDGNY